MMTVPERDPIASELKVLSEISVKVPLVGADRSKVKGSSELVVTPKSLLTVFVKAQAALELVSVGQTYSMESEFEPT